MILILENAINWNSIEEAKLMILKGRELTKNTEVKTLSKFQLFCSENIVNSEHKEYCLKRMLTFDMAKKLFDYGRSIGQEVFFTPMNLESVDWIERIGCRYIKIRYYDRFNWDLLSKVIGTGKELIFSVGTDLNFTYDIPTTSKLLFCVPKYPAHIDEYRRVLSLYFKRYDGISDHTPNLELLKDCLKQNWYEYFERHVCLSKENCLEAQWASEFIELEEVLTK